MPRPIPDYWERIRQIESYELQVQRANATADSFAPAQAALLSTLTNFYPGIPPGILMPLAKEGFGPEDPVTEFVLGQAMQQQEQEKGSYGAQWGDMSNPPIKSSNDPRKSFNTKPLTDLELPEAAPFKDFKPKEQFVRSGATVREGLELGEAGAPAPHPATLSTSELIDKAATLGLVTSDGYLTEPASIQEVKAQNKAFHELSAEERSQWNTFTELSSRIKATYPRVDQRAQEDGGVIFHPIVDQTGNPAPPLLTNEQEDELYYERLEHQRLTGVSQDPLQAKIFGTPGIKQLTDVTEEAFSHMPAVTRGFTMAADALPQEVQGLSRSIYGATTGEGFRLQSQSDLGIVLPRLLTGKEIDTGYGYTTGQQSGVVEERKRREAQYGMIGSHTPTLGRIFANFVTEPDTKPYNTMSGLLDAGVQVLDPLVVGKLGKISKTRQLFTAAETSQTGAFKTWHKFVDGPTAERFLDNNPKLVKKFTELRDPWEISKLTNHQLDPALTLDIANQSDEVGTYNTLRNAIYQGKVRETTQLKEQPFQRFTKLTGQGALKTYQTLQPGHTPRTVRLFQMMPQHQIRVGDYGHAAKTLVRAMDNAHAAEEDVADIYRMVANAAQQDSPQLLYKATEEALRKQNGLLDLYGIKDQTYRDTLTKFTDYSGARRGLTYELTSGAPVTDTIPVGGNLVQVPGPHYLVQHFNSVINLPNQRAIRRLTSRWNWVTSAHSRDITPGIKQAREAARKVFDIENVTPDGTARVPVIALDWMMQQVWKPAQLLRLAWPIRVIGETQARMASASVDSMFRHPMDYIGFVTALPKSRLASLNKKLGVTPKAVFGPDGALVDEYEEFTAALTNVRKDRLYQPEASSYSNVPTLYSKADPHTDVEFRHSWAQQMALYVNDPVAQRIASTSTTDEVTDWLFKGPGKKFRRRLVDAGQNLTSRKATKAYVQRSEAHFRTVTGGDTTLQDAIRNNNLNGVSLFDNRGDINGKFTEALAGHLDAAPDKVDGFAAVRPSFKEKELENVSKAADGIFSALMGAPDNLLARAPSYRQYLWQHTAELLPFADEPTKAKVLANARKANVSKRQLRNLERQAKTVSQADRKIGLDEITTLSKGYALESTNDLLYQLAERGQVWDALRIAVPFGDAWQEVITRWSKLATMRGPLGVPMPGRPFFTANDVLKTLKDPGVGEAVGGPEGKGIAYPNEHGEWMFTYPGSRFLNESVTGVPIPLEGRLKGLNMFGEIIPGVGPVAQVPMAWYLEDKPEAAALRNLFLPFGAPGQAEGRAGLIDWRSYTPTWMSKAIDYWQFDPESDRAHANTVMDVATYLDSTGKYDNTPEGRSRLLGEARRKARNLSGVLAIVSNIAPAAPSPEVLLKDKAGVELALGAIKERYYQLIGDDPDTAMQRFIEEFGFDPMLAIIPRSSKVPNAVISSLEGAVWAKDNPEVKETAPLVYALFAPEGEFDYPTYTQSFLTGEREALSPKQWIELYDNYMGNYFFGQVQEKVRGDFSEEALRWKGDWRDNLEQMYPGFMYGGQSTTGRPQNPPTEALIDQIKLAMELPAVADSEAGQGLTLYMRARARVEQDALARGFKTFSSGNGSPVEMEPGRQWLHSIATQISEQYPEFERIYTSVLERETR